jgi:flagellar biosynthetic protein FliR
MEVINAFFSEIDFFLIVLFRLTGFMIISAFWGSKEIPSMLKIAFSLILTFMIIMTGRLEGATLPTSFAAFVIVCIIEILKGMLIGFISNIFFSAFVTTGQIIDSMIGFRMGGILDPNFGVQMPQSARLLNIAAMVVFLQLNGHLHMIRALTESFEKSPVGTLVSIESLMGIFTSAFSFAYLAAVRVAIPVILIFLLTNVVLGIMIKFVPQLNIFVVGIPLKIILGIYSFIFLVQPFIEYLDSFFGTMFNLITNLFA